jgi:hypothetical protein
MYNLLLVKLNKTGDITMNQRDFLSHNQVVSLIKAVGDKRTVLIMGENGIGKTSVHRTLCADPDFSTHFKVPPIDCTQLSDGSLFMPDIDRERGVSRELPNERLGISFNNQRGSMNQQPVMLFFDEVAKVPQFVKNMIAPVAYERRAGSMFMPDKSVVIMATNLAMEGLGDYLEAHLRNRIIVVYMRKPSLDEFMNDFAIPNKLNPILLACLEEHPEAFDSFIDYLSGGKHAGKDQSKDNPIIYNPSESQDAYATPRSFHAASDILDGMDRLDGTTLEQALNGAVGKAFTSILMSFIRFGQQVPSSADIKADPLNVPVPTNKLAQQIVVFRSISQTHTRDDAGAFTRYIRRLQPEMQSLFCRRVSHGAHAAMTLYCSINEFTQMMADNRIFYAV